MSPQLPSVLAALALLGTSPLVRLQGKLFSHEGPPRLIFIQSVYLQADRDGERLASVYLDPEGREVVSESAVSAQGVLTHYRIDLFQLGEWGTVEARGGDVRFTFSSHGTVEHGEETLPEGEELLVPATMLSLMQRRLPELLAGRSIAARLALVERRETVGVVISKLAEEVRGGRELVRLRVRPASLILRLLAPTIEVTLGRRDGRPVLYRGRVLPRLLEDGVYRDVDADIEFE